MLARKLSLFLLLCVIVLFAVQPAMADKVYTYTLTEQFENGLEGGSAQLVDVNAGGNQLQLSEKDISYPFVNIAATGRGTIVRIDAASGEIVGEYRTAPESLSATPSRISMDSEWNVWTANQGEITFGGPVGDSVVKIGVVIGGTAYAPVNNPAPDGPKFTENESGEYLLGPFIYNTCVDRDNDGYIRTSRGLNNVLPWPNNGDGSDDAADECILIFQRLSNATHLHHVSVDGSNNVWVGDYTGLVPTSLHPAMFYKLKGDSGDELESFDASIATGFGCGGFGGLVDDNGILWSASPTQSKLLHYNPADGSGGCIGVASSFGVAESVIEQEEKTDDFIWNSSKWFPNQITKINATTFQTVVGFPKSTVVAGDLDGFEDRGVAVTPVDNNVWVVIAGAQQLRRLDSAGNLLNDGIPLTNPLNGESAREPTGTAVDLNGKIWVANLGRDNVMRIDPTAGDDGFGAVDLTVYLGEAAAPNSYSDMTKAMPITMTSSQGTWTVINDGGEAETSWDEITWNTEPGGSQPEGTSIAVEAQAANNEDDLSNDNNYVMVSNGGSLDLDGQYIKIRATLTANSAGMSPVLYDLEIRSLKTATVCDVNSDGIIDNEDIQAIFEDRRQAATGPDDPRDWDKDGTISVLDARGCVLECKNPGCSQ